MENFVSKELNENPGGLVYSEPRNYRRIPNLDHRVQGKGCDVNIDHSDLYTVI